MLYIIEQVYDTLMALTRAMMLRDGFIASGEGAHAAEVAFLRTYHIPEHDIRRLNELRNHRNGILYYGKEFNKEYAEKTLVLLAKLFPKLYSQGEAVSDK